MIIKFKSGVTKELFKKMTGRPKEGDVVECINPAIVLPTAMISFLCMLWAIKFHNVFLGIFSMMFAWQIGWGMSIERFKNSEKKMKEKRIITNDTKLNLQNKLKQKYLDCNFLVKEECMNVLIIYDNRKYISDNKFLDEVIDIVTEFLSEDDLWKMAVVYDFDNEIGKN